MQKRRRRRTIVVGILDPAKVTTLKGDRPANARLYKVLGWLETARQPLT